jgi:hypothetical protein
MNCSRFSVRLLCVLALAWGAVSAQDRDGFDLSAYSRFLAGHQNMSGEELLALHPAGIFTAQAGVTPLTSVPYFARIDSFYHYTAYELEMLRQHGFVVSERLKRHSIGAVYQEAWVDDLPVVVTTDAILHAFHMSYDNILKTAELQILISTLDTLLTRLHGGVPALAILYAAQPAMAVPLRDMDFYLAVARKLLGHGGDPVYPENASRVLDMLGNITAEMPGEVLLFGGESRLVDFSQFRPRGHYADDPKLQAYFKSMIWLGRTEIYCSAPASAGAPPSESAVQMQTIMAALLVESANATGAMRYFDRVEQILQFFVGEQDNISLGQLSTFLAEQGITRADALLPADVWKAFQERLLQQSYAAQRIISQMLWSDPYSPDQIVPASAFLLVGQRFVVDSYVTGNVVYDRIIYQGEKILRMLPSTLDVLFALGNDAAGQLLQPKLAQYHYASNLAALRYLVDGYGPSFWESTLYNGWLNALRTLNPPLERGSLPPFMQTAAWWQEKMNTQLAGWAQLRHDNLLYAKQSYTGMVICSFPESYVEPIPAFYDAMKEMAMRASARFTSPDLAALGQVDSYFGNMAAIMDTLASIARKELSSTPLLEAEKNFLHTMLYEVPSGCTVAPAGWYVQLFYTGESGLKAPDYIVADVHTSPTDEAGGMVGWVVHAGTGPVNLGTFIVTLPDGQRIACVGPVLSYFEYVSVNFERLTDEEWKTQYLTLPATRPDFVNLYLADAAGNSRGTGSALLTTDVLPPPEPVEQPVSFALLQSYPNPFNSTTIIPLTVKAMYGDQHVELAVYDVQGRLVRTLLRADLPGGHYLVRWDGINDENTAVASGTYLYTLRAGAWSDTKKVVLLR